MYVMYMCTLRQIGGLLLGFTLFSLAVAFNVDAALIQGAVIEFMSNNYGNCGY